MIDPLKPYYYVRTLFGAEPEIIELSDQHLNTSVTITGADSGIITIEAQAAYNNTFEEVMGGRLDLAHNRTLKINGYKLKALRLTSSLRRAYTVRASQYPHAQ